MEERVELCLAMLAEAEEEGEDGEFVELVDRVGRRVRLRGEAEELSDLLDLPPRVALRRLMDREGWREAMKEAARRYVEAKLRRLRE